MLVDIPVTPVASRVWWRVFVAYIVAVYRHQLIARLRYLKTGYNPMKNDKMLANGEMKSRSPCVGHGDSVYHMCAYVLLNIFVTDKYASDFFACPT